MEFAVLAGPIAQLVELPAHNRLVPGSSPGGPIKLKVGTLNEQLNFLVELQKLDTVILSDRSKIDAIPERISSEEGPFKKAQAAFDNAKERH